MGDFWVKLSDLGLSQAEFSRRLGLHENTVMGWKHGVVPGYAEAYVDLMIEHRDYVEAVKSLARRIVG